MNDENAKKKIKKKKDEINDIFLVLDLKTSTLEFRDRTGSKSRHRTTTKN